MKNTLFILAFFFINLNLAQEVEEEFLPIVIEEKDAFMSTKTGEYVFRSHAETNPEELSTTPSGVVYNDISYHTVKKGETLSSVAKQYNLSIDELKRDNKLKSNDLSLGQDIKIVVRVIVPSSSPVISYAGEERIIASLRPGESPATLAPPPVSPTVSVTKQEKTTSPDSKKPTQKQSTFYKPMVVPTVATKSEDLEEDTEEVIEVESEEESEEIKDAKRQLEDARKKLELAKQKVIEKEKQAKQELEKEEKIKETSQEVEAVIVEEVEEEVIEKTVIEAEEVIEEDNTQTPDYHVIVKGDNLYNLAKKYNTTVKKLTKLNNVKFNNLKIGQKLKLK